MMRTYQCRLLPTPDAEVSLASYAEQYGKAERTLFNKLAAGDDAGKLKPSFMKEHSLTARRFNAMAFSMKGKKGSPKTLASPSSWRTSDRLPPSKNWMD